MTDAAQPIRQGPGDGPILLGRLRRVGSVPGGLTGSFAAFVQVARTYWRRPRFWVFGGCYLFAALVGVPRWGLTYHPSPFDLALFVSVMLACVVASLAALHLRRLLSGPVAHVVPDFVAPHLAIGALVSLLIWVAIPCAQAAITGHGVFYLVSLHALAGVLGALVLFFPQSILLLGLGPLAAMWASVPHRTGALFLRSFGAGEEPATGALVIALGVLTYPLAALALLRTLDRSATFSDDLVVDRSHQVSSRWKNWLLGLRDPTIEWQLNARGDLGGAVRRWRIPCVVSARELLLLVGAVAGWMVAAWLAVGDPEAPLLVANLASFVALFIPLSSWRYRATALAGEFMRPVARAVFVRQFFAAMVLDFCSWTLLATLLMAIGLISLLPEAPTKLADVPYVVFGLCCWAIFLWALAALLYGIALATLRVRYWLPWFAGLFLAALFGIGYGVIGTFHWHAQAFGRANNNYLFAALVLAFAGFGCALGWWAYRRWLTMDID